MGYTTEFNGSFRLSKTATPEQVKYINLFAYTRRMRRNNKVLFELYKGKFGLIGCDKKVKNGTAIPNDYGIDGEFFCRDDNDFGQSKDSSIIDFNGPPKTQPGLWCKWELSEDGKELKWNEVEKFYGYTLWLKYLIEKFFIPWGIELNGRVRFQGEDSNDFGTITIIKNKISLQQIGIR